MFGGQEGTQSEQCEDWHSPEEPSKARAEEMFGAKSGMVLERLQKRDLKDEGFSFYKDPSACTLQTVWNEAEQMWGAQSEGCCKVRWQPGVRWEMDRNGQIKRQLGHKVTMDLCFVKFEE